MTHEPRVTGAEWVLRAFPAALRPEAAEVAQALPPPTSTPSGATLPESSGTIPVALDGEILVLPKRIYHGVLPADTPFTSSRSRAVAACTSTRHHNGYVRQRALRALLDGPCALQPWVVPYVVELVGEYVVEIVDDIAAFLTGVDVAGSPQQRAYGRVLAQNPEMLRLLRARVISYWDCYYRLEEYPGHRLALALSRAAAFERAPWPPPGPQGRPGH